MNIETALLAYCAVAITADLYVSARFMRPTKRRAAHLELARVAVAAAEQKPALKEAADKARYARQYLIDHGVKPAAADVLVEKAVAELKK
jgi:hypothetical protein